MNCKCLLQPFLGLHPALNRQYFLLKDLTNIHKGAVIFTLNPGTQAGFSCNIPYLFVRPAPFISSSHQTTWTVCIASSLMVSPMNDSGGTTFDLSFLEVQRERRKDVDIA